MHRTITKHSQTETEGVGKFITGWWGHSLTIPLIVFPTSPNYSCFISLSVFRCRPVEVVVVLVVIVELNNSAHHKLTHNNIIVRAMNHRGQLNNLRSWLHFSHTHDVLINDPALRDVADARETRWPEFAALRCVSTTKYGQGLK